MADTAGNPEASAGGAPAVRASLSSSRDLTSGSISRAIWTLAVPTMLANAVAVVINLTDQKFVSMLGEASIAAVGVSRPIMFLLSALFMGVSAAATAMVARAVGASDTDRADHVAGQALVLSVLVSAALAVAGYLAAPRLLAGMATPPSVYPLALGYLRVNFLGIVSMFTLFVANGILRGAGDAMTPLKLSALAAGLNVVFDPLLIFGLGGLPRLGVSGAATASVTAQIVASIAGLYILASGRLRLRLRLRDFAFDGSVLRRIVAIGVPASLQMSLRALMVVVLTRFVAGFGKSVMAAYTVAMSLEQIAFMPTFGIAEASATLVGQNLGARQPDRARRSAFTAMGYAMAVMGSLGLAFAGGAPQMMRLFSLSAEGVATGRVLLRINALSLLFSGMGISLNRALNGAGDTLPGLVITVVALWGVQVPLAWYLKTLPWLGPTGIWIAMTFASFLQGLATLAYFSTGRWQRAKA